MEKYYKTPSSTIDATGFQNARLKALKKHTTPARFSARLCLGVRWYCVQKNVSPLWNPTPLYTLRTEKLLIWRIIFFIWEMDQRLRLNEIHMKSLLLVSKVSKFYLALIERWRTKMWKYIYLVQCTKIIDTFWKVSFVCNNVLLFAFPPKLVS